MTGDVVPVDCDVVPAPVVLKVGMDGVVARVPFEANERSSGPFLREHIGCALFDVIRLDGRVDMWVDDEAIIDVDLTDREAVAAEVNVVATVIAHRLGQARLVFGAAVITGVAGGNTVPLTGGQLSIVEHIAAEAVLAFADVLATRAGRAQNNLTIKVENTYSDGHESTVIETVEVQPFNEIEELWEQLQERTGDGHDVDGDLGYCYTITILEAAEHPALVGSSNEWVGA